MLFDNLHMLKGREFFFLLLLEKPLINILERIWKVKVKMHQSFIVKVDVLWFQPILLLRYGSITFIIQSFHLLLHNYSFYFLFSFVLRQIEIMSAKPTDGLVDCHM